MTRDRHLETSYKVHGHTSVRLDPATNYISLKSTMGTISVPTFVITLPLVLPVSNPVLNLDGEIVYVDTPYATCGRIP